MVNVFEEQIQCRDSLRKPTFDLAPFVVGNDPRQKIIRKDALRSLFIPIDSECDALMQKRQVRRLLALAHFLGRQSQKGLKKRLIMRTRKAWSLEHLIVGGVKLIIPKGRTEQRACRLLHGHGSQDPSCSSTTMLHSEDFRRRSSPSPIEIVYGCDSVFRDASVRCIEGTGRLFPSDPQRVGYAIDVVEPGRDQCNLQDCLIVESGGA